MSHPPVPAPPTVRAPKDNLLWRSRLLLTLIAVATVVVGLALPALAHAELVESSPADGAQLDTPPEEVLLVFNEPVSVTAGSVRVYDADGRRVDRGDTHKGDAPEEVVVSLGDLDAGPYVVTWRAVSADGHPIKGAFVFEVGEGGEQLDESFIASLLGGTSDTPFEVVGWILRWVTYAATLMVVGLVVFGMAIAPGAARRLDGLVKVGVIVGVVCSVLELPMFAAEVSGLGFGAFVSPEALGEALTSSVALASLVRVVGLGLIFLGWSRSARAVTIAGVAVTVVAELLTGHTRTVEPMWLMIAADAVHVVSSGIWFGGLIGLATTIRDEREVGHATGAAQALATFSRLAVYTVVAVSAAGLALAVVQVRTWHALTSTTYGWTLIAKVLVVAGVVAVAAYNNRVLVPSIVRDEEADPRDDSAPDRWPRLWKTIRIEIAGLVVVIGATALLVNLEPAAEAAGVSGPYSTYVEFGVGQLNLVVDPNRAGINEIHLYVLTAGGLPALITGEVTLEMSMPTQDIGPIVRTPQIAGPGHYTHTGPELAIPGEWVITVRQKTSQFEEAVAEIPVVVGG
jgi:copper transport protein